MAARAVWRSEAMTRLEVALTEEQMAALEELAKARHVSVAELARQGVVRMFETASRRRDPELKRRAIAVIGKFRSERGDLSARHDDYFAEACEE
jgi:predicted transcriptional regulator